MARTRAAIAIAATLALALAACGEEDPDRNPTGGGGTTATGTAGGTQTGTPGGTQTGTPGGTQTGTPGGTQTGADPYAAARQACYDKINALRATKGLDPYERWASAESCADQQATQDEQSGSSHGSFGDCGESSQNECLGGGASGIENCLDSMWAEKDQSNCSGCDACADAYNPNCPNCDFYGPPACGHYVNMSAMYRTRMVCGFSSLGGWAVIDFN